VNACHILGFMDRCNLLEAKTVNFALALAAMPIVSIPLPGQEVGAEDSSKNAGIDYPLVGRLAPRAGVIDANVAGGNGDECKNQGERWFIPRGGA
jgi:hypothetical protein